MSDQLYRLNPPSIGKTKPSREVSDWINAHLVSVEPDYEAAWNVLADWSTMGRGVPSGVVKEIVDAAYEGADNGEA